MSLWRRRRPLHERLAEQGGLEFGQPRPPHDVRPRWGEVGIHGVHRPREFDAVEVVETDTLQGERVAFAALPDGTLLIEEGGGDVSVLAEAVERSVPPPYRAEATRRLDRFWAVGARRIEVVALANEVEGDEIEIAVRGDERSAAVDSVPALAVFPELEALGASRYEAFAIQASRLDENLWEVGISPL